MQHRIKRLILLAGVTVASFLVAVHFVGIPPVRAHFPVREDACINNLRAINGAKQQWALENPTLTNHTLLWSDVQPYLGRGINGTLPVCPLGGTYTLGKLGEPPKCSYPGHVWSD